MRHRPPTRPPGRGDYGHNDRGRSATERLPCIAVSCMTPWSRYAVPHTRRMVPITRHTRANAVTTTVAVARLIQPLRANNVDEASQRVPLLPLRVPHSQVGKKPSKWGAARRPEREGENEHYQGQQLSSAARIDKVTVIVA